MKKKQIITGLLLLGGIGAILFTVTHLFYLGGWGYRNMAAWPNGGSQMHGFHHGFGHGHFGAGQAIFGFGSILVALFIVAVGWFLRKNAGESMWKKWSGWVLIGIGALMFIRRIAPLVLLIIIGVVIWKFVIKGNKKHEAETYASDLSFESLTPVSNRTGDMLDEWERNIKKEEHE